MVLRRPASTCKPCGQSHRQGEELEVDTPHFTAAWIEPTGFG
jgi:hypothetical protein